MSWFRKWQQKKSRTASLHAEAMAHFNRLAGWAEQVSGRGELALADDFSLRFELVILVVSLSLFRLGRSTDPQSGEAAQALWEATFEGFEYSLRLRGTPDLRIAARMRKLFMYATGRRNAYLAALEDNDEDALHLAIARNVLNGAEGNDPRVAPLLMEARAADQSLQG